MLSKLMFFFSFVIITIFAKEKLEFPKHKEVNHYKGFSLAYSEEYEQPLWVAYELTKKEVRGTISRSNNFAPDPTIKTGSATLSDYKKSGYDRGHLAPAADMKWHKKAMNECFYMSNMSPQKAEFNRGIWKDLESQVRKWAVENSALLVVTGPIFSSRPRRIGKNRVAVPNAYYKVVIDYRLPTRKGIGFIIPHNGSKKSLKSFAVSIDKVEKETGIDFFYALPDNDENSLEKKINLDRWSWSTRKSFFKKSSSSYHKKRNIKKSSKSYNKKSKSNYKKSPKRRSKKSSKKSKSYNTK